MPDSGAAEALVAGWLPPGFAVASGDLTAAATDPDLPAGLVPGRAREFAAGRAAARLAAARARLVLDRLPMGADRAPVWPAGMAGTISHSGQLCLAVVGPVAEGWPGLDLEPLGALDPALWPEVLDAGERQALDGAAEPTLRALAMFCAKEAAYKAQYPLTRRLIGFDGLRVRLSGDRFTATFRQDVPPFAPCQSIVGRWGVADGHVLALAGPRDGPPRAKNPPRP